MGVSDQAALMECRRAGGIDCDGPIEVGDGEIETAFGAPQAAAHGERAWVPGIEADRLIEVDDGPFGLASLVAQSCQSGDGSAAPGDAVSAVSPMIG